MTADPGIVGLTYGDRGNVVLESGSLTDINSKSRNKLEKGLRRNASALFLLPKSNIN